MGSRIPFGIQQLLRVASHTQSTAAPAHAMRSLAMRHAATLAAVDRIDCTHARRATPMAPPVHSAQTPMFLRAPTLTLKRTMLTTTPTTPPSAQSQVHSLGQHTLADRHVVVAGGGAMGRAALGYLMEGGIAPQHITVVDPSPINLQHHGAEPATQAALAKIKTQQVGVQDEAAFEKIIRESGAHAIVCMVPPHLAHHVARVSINVGIPFVSTNFPHDSVTQLHAAAQAKDVLVLVGAGLDPGIDMLLLQHALQGFRHVQSVRTYGSGVPEHPGRNPLNYAVTWRFRGFLDACMRDAVQRHAGQAQRIPGHTIFHPEHTHTITLDDGRMMEAYPNGNALSLVDDFPILRGATHVGAYTLRWPGHCAFFQQLVDFGFLDATHALAPSAATPFGFVSAHVQRMVATSAAGIHDPVWQALARGDGTPQSIATLISAPSISIHPFWKKMAQLHFFDAHQTAIAACATPSAATMRDVVAAHLEPQLQLGSTERDMAYIRVEVEGTTADGTAQRACSEFVDYRDLSRQHLAMGQGVARTAAHSALQIIQGQMRATGVQTLCTIPPQQATTLLDSLKSAGMVFRHTRT